MTWQEAAIYAGYVVVKSPFRNLLALAAAPAAAALIGDRLARLAPRALAAPLAASLLAAAPGLVALAVIGHAIDLGKVLTWRGVVFHWLTPLVATGLVAWALLRTAQRQWQVAQLFALARPAHGRLASVAADLGLRALEIPIDATDCFVAGVLRPAVFVSSGALARLDEAELRAALCHERAHLAHRDTLSLLLLAFLRDLAPWGRGAALDAFRATREAAADRAAARTAGRFNLASALLVLARPAPELGGGAVLRMARADTFRWRMQALLDDDAAPPPSRGEWAGLIAGLAFSVALVAWPAIQDHLTELFCAVG